MKKMKVMLDASEEQPILSAESPIGTTEPEQISIEEYLTEIESSTEPSSEPSSEDTEEDTDAHIIDRQLTWNTLFSSQSMFLTPYIRSPFKIFKDTSANTDSSRVHLPETIYREFYPTLFSNNPRPFICIPSHLVEFFEDIEYAFRELKQAEVITSCQHTVLMVETEEVLPLDEPTFQEVNRVLSELNTGLTMIHSDKYNRSNFGYLASFSVSHDKNNQITTPQGE